MDRDSAASLGHLSLTEKCASLRSDGIPCGFLGAHCLLSRAESDPLILAPSQQVLEHTGQISQSLLEQPQLSWLLLLCKMLQSLYHLSGPGIWTGA